MFLSTFFIRVFTRGVKVRLFLLATVMKHVDKDIDKNNKQRLGCFHATQSTLSTLMSIFHGIMTRFSDPEHCLMAVAVVALIDVLIYVFPTPFRPRAESATFWLASLMIRWALHLALKLAVAESCGCVVIVGRSKSRTFTPRSKNGMKIVDKNNRRQQEQCPTWT
jgi:hypothetical protein